MDVKYCPSCRSEYVPRISECPDCGVELVERLPAVSEDRPGSPVEARPATDHLEYDLGAWSVEQREMLDRLLTGAAGDSTPAIPVAYAWEGTTLVIPAGSAPMVDELLARVEVDVDLALDPAADKVAYDCAGLPDDQLESLLDALVREEIPFALTGDEELFVLEADEARVEAIFDVVVDPDELEAEADDGMGRVAPDVLGEVFVAADRLRKDARDAEGVLGLVAGLEAIHEVPLPYGFRSELWNSFIDDIAGLSGLLHDDDSSDTDIEEAAAALRRRLRDYV